MTSSTSLPFRFRAPQAAAFLLALSLSSAASADPAPPPAPPPATERYSKPLMIGGIVLASAGTVSLASRAKWFALWG